MANAFLTNHITHNGKDYKVEFVYDESFCEPWENCTPLAEVRTLKHRNEKRSSERIFQGDHRHATIFAYDFAEAVKNLRDQGLSGEDAVKGAEYEFQHFRGWVRNDWHYIGIIVTERCTCSHGHEHDGDFQSLWGIESNDDIHHADIVNELLRQFK